MIRPDGRCAEQRDVSIALALVATWMLHEPAMRDEPGVLIRRVLDLVESTCGGRDADRPD